MAGEIQNKGRIYLIPTLIAENTFNEVLPRKTLELCNRINYYLVENARSARRFLKKLGIHQPIDSLAIETIDKHKDSSSIEKLIQPILDGVDCGIMSEAGCPGIADPGAKVVALAHKLGIKVVPMVGPSSILLAQMASGLNGQNFAFIGYLPIDKTARITTIKKIEITSKKSGQTQIFMETPYRNQGLLNDLINTCHPETYICIACEITGADEYIKTRRVKDWKKHKINIHKKPSLFLLFASK